MMHLRALTEQLGGVCLDPEGGPMISDVHLDSRRVGVGDLYTALPGTKANGAHFIGDAAGRGAKAVLTPHELDPRSLHPPGGGSPLAQWVHPDARRVAGLAASFLHGEPTRQISVAGVTGTNGKTTTAHILGHLLECAGKSPAVLGTAGHRLAGGERRVATHTTPDAPELQRLMRRHLDGGGRSAVMEVSSHALVQERTAGVDFRVAAFTNITREHLDYHGDMGRYIEAKALLFSSLRRGSFAVLRSDDLNWETMAEAAKDAGAHVFTYSTQSDSDLRCSRLRTGPQGSLFKLDGMGIKSTEMRLPLRGRYNVENALAASAAALLMGAGPSSVLEGLATTPSVPGRLEPVPTGKRGFDLFVDYAHSPDALERVLTVLRSDLEQASGRLIVVFGCGGDRDPGKRPQMGRVAARLSDVAIVTSDNPRTEDPEGIVADIIAGMGEQEKATREVECDRRRAIERAVQIARPGDVVLVAGKGHETSQVVGDETLSFDDRRVAQEALA